MYVRSSFIVPQMWFSMLAIRELGPQPLDELRALGLEGKPHVSLDSITLPSSNMELLYIDR